MKTRAPATLSTEVNHCFQGTQREIAPSIQSGCSVLASLGTPEKNLPGQTAWQVPGHLHF